MLTQAKIELNNEILKTQNTLLQMLQMDWPEANIQYTKRRLAQLVKQRRDLAVSNLDFVQITRTGRGTIVLPAVEIIVIDDMIHVEFDWMPFLDGPTQIYSVQTLVTHYPEEEGGQPTVSPLLECHEDRVIPACERMTWDTDIPYTLDGLEAPRFPLAPELTLAELDY